ncbi:ABC transporter substrate-binding protein [Pseudonocardia pini]|uniref:ABC transporter substrate-binding protein n=1 Tax=Pseudonocardia pini TaxID=2758030 RepID=UPI0015F0348D|nr:ABC transporter substrate-binding protein [Pseudonocardia pini]
MSFTRWRTAAGAVALLLLVAACGGGGTDSAAGGTGEVDRNGTLRATYVILPTPLDPHTPTSEVAQFPYISPVYDRLTQMVHGEKGQELAPMVAESWEFSPDGATLTFALRDDVTFSDGSKLDSSAVKASLDRALTLPKSTAKSYLSAIGRVDAPDPATVVITTSRPAADLPYLLSTGYGSIINPKALANPDLDVAPQGSGAYTVSSVKQGDSVTYERREGYWDPEASKAKTIVIRGLVDANARLSDIRSGQSDVTLLQTQQFEEASSLGSGFSVHTYENTGTRQALAINQYRPYMGDVRVRQALNYAVDRQAVVDAIMDGHAKPNLQPLAANEAGFLATPTSSYGFDPAKARQLLQEAGVPEGHEVNMVSANYSPAQDIAKVVQDQLGKVGLKVNIEYQDALGSITAYTKESKFDLSTGVRVGFETPRLTLANSYLSSRTLLNPTPPEFSAALDRASDPRLSDDERTKVLEQAETVATDQAFDVFMAGEGTTLLTTDKVTGIDSMGRSDYQGIFDLRYVGITS